MKMAALCFPLELLKFKIAQLALGFVSKMYWYGKILKFSSVLMFKNWLLALPETQHISV